MKYIAINSDGFISKITAKDTEEAFFAFDQIAFDDREDWILLTEKIAKIVAKNILKIKP